MAGFAVPFAIGAGSSILSSIFGAKGAAKSAKILSEAGLKEAQRTEQAKQNAEHSLIENATAANNTLGQVYADLGTQLNPYRVAGEQGLNMLTAALQPGGDLSQKFAFNPKDLERDPGYQFQLNEGLKAVKNAYAAQGAGGTGGAMKSVANFVKGLTDTTYNQAYGRAANTFDMNHKNTLQALMALTGVGQKAVDQSIGVGENYGNNMSRNYMNLGNELADTGMKGDAMISDILMQRANAQAAGVQGKYNSITKGIQGVGQAGLSAWYGRNDPGFGGGHVPRYSDGTPWRT